MSELLDRELHAKCKEFWLRLMRERGSAFAAESYCKVLWCEVKPWMKKVEDHYMKHYSLVTYK